MAIRQPPIVLAGCCAALLLWAAAAQAAQETANDFTAPLPIGDSHVTYPSNAPDHEDPISVVVSIQINKLGEVEEIKLLQSGGPVFDQAVLLAAAHFSFQPALYKGEPHTSSIRYTAHFPVPETKQPKSTEIKSTATLSGEALERGTLRKVLDGQVIASHPSHGTQRRLLHDAAFSLKLQPGTWTIEVKAPGFNPFVFQQKVAKEGLTLRCLLERKSYNEYEEVVIGKRARVEVSRTSLRGREIHRVPGTFGDPFKVTNTMPGVSQLMSLLPLPVIRGVGPSQSGFLLDGIALPLFYHSLAGPSVVHPEFIERIDFSAGNSAAKYGDYTGGIIDGVSKLPFQKQDSSYSIDLNLIQGGGFIREVYESVDTEIIAAARIGYPNGILSLLNSQTRLSYWDYQTRIAWGDRNLYLSAMFLGAHDKLQTLDSKLENGQVVEFSKPTLWAEFHKIILKMRHQSPVLTGNYHLALSYDLSALESVEPSARSLGLAPHLDWQWSILKSLKLMAGIEAEFRDLSLYDNAINQAEDENPTQVFLTQATAGLHKDAGTWLSLSYEPIDAWFITPGIRVDVYSNTDQSHWAVQPRLQVRGRIFKQEEQSLWLKAASGIYQQPPRPYFTLPGLSVTALDLGLLKSHQNMVGAEWSLNSEWSLDLQTYYNHLDPTLFELNLSENQEEEQPNQSPYEPPSNQDEQGWLTGLSGNSSGRAYGFEVMLRKEGSGQFFGWLSYALSRSERWQRQGYIAYDFDRTHILNLVAGMKFSGNWEIGSRFVFQTGTPLNTDNGGIASGRSLPNWRVDLRIDKRVVFNQWLLDFYVEILNVAVTHESGGLLSENGFRYVLPTLGLKANL